LGFDYTTGLIHGSDFTAKPAYPVYTEVLKRLGNAKYMSTVSAPSPGHDLEVYEFKDLVTLKTFYVAWLNPTILTSSAAVGFDDNATQTIKLGGEKATVFAKDGAKQAVLFDTTDGADDANVTITVGHSPIYIVIN